jgi:hypothetical protein
LRRRAFRFCNFNWEAGTRTALTNFAALRFGRHPSLTVLMMGSAVVALAIGLSIQAAPTRLLVLRVPRTPDEGRIALHTGPLDRLSSHQRRSVGECGVL